MDLKLPEKKEKAFMERKGYLWKLGGKMSSWKLRYFVAAKGICSYYVSEMKMSGAKKPLGTIVIEGAKLDKYPANKFGKRTGFLFGVRPKAYKGRGLKKGYTFRVGSEEERNGWLNCFVANGAYFGKAEETETFFEGWLEVVNRRAKFTSSLSKKRFCVLKNVTMLCNESNAKDAKCARSIPLLQETTVIRTGECGFMINCLDKMKEFKAASYIEREEWVVSLEKRIRLVIELATEDEDIIFDAPDAPLNEEDGEDDEEEELQLTLDGPSTTSSSSFSASSTSSSSFSASSTAPASFSGTYANLSPRGSHINTSHNRQDSDTSTTSKRGSFHDNSNHSNSKNFNMNGAPPPPPGLSKASSLTKAKLTGNNSTPPVAPEDSPLVPLERLDISLTENNTSSAFSSASPMENVISDNNLMFGVRTRARSSSAAVPPPPPNTLSDGSGKGGRHRSISSGGHVNSPPITVAALPTSVSMLNISSVASSTTTAAATTITAATTTSTATTPNTTSDPPTTTTTDTATDATPDTATDTTTDAPINTADNTPTATTAMTTSTSNTNLNSPLGSPLPHSSSRAKLDSLKMSVSFSSPVPLLHSPSAQEIRTAKLRSLLAKEFEGDLEQFEQSFQTLIQEMQRGGMRNLNNNNSSSSNKIAVYDESADDTGNELPSPPRPPRLPSHPSSSNLLGSMVVSPRLGIANATPRNRVFDAESLLGMKSFAIHVEVTEAKLSRDLVAKDYYVDISVRNKKTKEVRSPETQTFKTKSVRAMFAPVWNVRTSLAYSAMDEEEVVFDLFESKTSECLGRAVLGDTDTDGWLMLYGLKDRAMTGMGWLYAVVTFTKTDFQTEKHATNAYVQARENLLEEKKLVIQSRPVAKDGERLSLFVGSWNVGNAPPPDDLSPWIPLSGFDVYAIGTQECKYKERGDFGSCKEDWGACLIRHFGSGYSRVKYETLWEMRLAVFVKNEHITKISQADSRTEATGIGNVIGNKGAVVISLNYLHTSICFVNCHLAAHQDKVTARNDDVSAIVRNTLVGPGNAMDIFTQFHHVIWMGDLNYRIDYDPTMRPNDKSRPARTPSQGLFSAMVDIIQNGEAYERFRPHDQLSRELEAGRLLVGFQDSHLGSTPPTFKVMREAGLQYDSQRSPAWCDRVLWKSCDGLLGTRMDQASFFAALSIASSDHKPICASFKLLVGLGDLGTASGRCLFSIPFLDCKNLIMPNKKKEKKEKKEKSSNFFSSGKSKDNATSKDEKHLPDVMVRVFAEFLPDPYCTPVSKGTLSPSWSELPVMTMCLTAARRIRQVLLYVQIVEMGGWSENIIARGSMPLRWDQERNVESIAVDINCQLTFAGQPAGNLEGTVSFKWIPADGDRSVRAR